MLNDVPNACIIVCMLCHTIWQCGLYLTELNVYRVFVASLRSSLTPKAAVLMANCNSQHNTIEDQG